MLTFAARHAKSSRPDVAGAAECLRPAQSNGLYLSFLSDCSSCLKSRVRLFKLSQAACPSFKRATPYPMDEPGESHGSGKATVVPPSLKPSAFWTLTCELSPGGVADVMPQFQTSAERLLAQRSNGGSDQVLQVVAFFLREADHVRPVLSHSAEPDVLSISTSPMKWVTGNWRLDIAFGFSGQGRLKSSVKRSIQGCLDEMEKAIDPTSKLIAAKRNPPRFSFQLLASLNPRTALGCLSLLQQASRVLPVWADTTFSDLGAYLVSRQSQDSASAATKMQLGLDLLGPQRKRPAEPPPGTMPFKLLKGAASSSSQQDQPAAPEDPAPSSDRLAALLAWDGELTPEIAKERALQLMTILHKTTEELAVAKMHLQYYKERDMLEAQVCD